MSGQKADNKEGRGWIAAAPESTMFLSPFLLFFILTLLKIAGANLKTPSQAEEGYLQKFPYHEEAHRMQHMLHWCGCISREFLVRICLLKK